MANRPLKGREMWILAGVTYALVIALTVAAAVVYFRWSAGGKAEPERGLVSVGSFWVASYPNATVGGENSSIHDGITQTTVRLKSTDPPEKLFAFYRDKLTNATFRVGNFSKTEFGTGTIRANRLDGKGQVLVTIRELPDGAESVITALERPRTK